MSAHRQRLAVGCYDRHPDPFFAERDFYTVNIISEALKTVAFLGIKKDGKFVPRATCFFVNYTDCGHRFLHLVTAEHVISGLLLRGHQIWLRVNVDGPKGVIEAPIAADSFRFHPENEQEPTDVAVCPFSDVFDDHEGRFNLAVRAMSLDVDDEVGFSPTDEFWKENIGLGAEIGIIGLFRSHYGTNQNIPVVRVGNISALPGEPIFTKYAGHIKAYLVEARSIAGLSGSPVLVIPDSAVLLAKLIAKQKIPKQGCALLGLMHGHFDVPNLNEDVVTDDDAPERGVHTGMGVVIPLNKIIETIKHPDFIAMRKEIVGRLREQKGAKADFIADDLVSAVDAGENPRHLEDFKRLVDVAARKRPQGDQT
jgi:hypothetical protein